MNCFPSDFWEMIKYLACTMLVQRYCEETGRHYMEQLHVEPVDCRANGPEGVLAIDGAGITVDLSVEEAARAAALVLTKWEPLNARWCAECERFNYASDMVAVVGASALACRWCAPIVAMCGESSGLRKAIPCEEPELDEDWEGNDGESDYLDDSDMDPGDDEDIYTSINGRD